MYRQKAVIADLAVARRILDLKQAALLFDEIVVLRTSTSQWDPRTKAVLTEGLFGRETAWLEAQGIVRFESDETVDDIAKIDPTYAEDREQVHAALCSSLLCRYDSPEFETIIQTGASRSARSAAVVLRLREEADIVPFVLGEARRSSPSTSPVHGKDGLTSQNESATLAMTVVFKSLPSPDELTPWEAIVEYRQDPDARRAFAALRQWVNEANKTAVSARELGDKLEWQLQQYQETLRVHRMKYRLQMLETIIATPIAVVEKVLKMQWSDAARSLFAISKVNLERMESELKLPNRELHYLVDVTERFSDKKSTKETARRVDEE